MFLGEEKNTCVAANPYQPFVSETAGLGVMVFLCYMAWLCLLLDNYLQTHQQLQKLY